VDPALFRAPVPRSVRGMTGERPKSPGGRSFVALDLPDATREAVVTWGRQALRDPALRVVPPESLHITLAFLGYLPEREIGRVGEMVRGLKAAAPLVRLGDPTAKPTLRKARVFALPVESPGTISLHSTLQESLVSERLYKPEQRAFWPHVTVARVKPEGRGSKRPRALQNRPGALPRALLEPVRCVRVTLYRSELNPQGARYTPLAQVELSQRGRQ
jgi:2'-5' RNA ligase